MLDQKLEVSEIFVFDAHTEKLNLVFHWSQLEVSYSYLLFSFFSQSLLNPVFLSVCLFLLMIIILFLNYFTTMTEF